MTIPKGQYYLFFETNYREISLDPSISDTAILYSAAIADIKYEPGNCVDLGGYLDIVMSGRVNKSKARDILNVFLPSAAALSFNGVG